MFKNSDEIEPEVFHEYERFWKSIHQSRTPEIHDWINHRFGGHPAPVWPGMELDCEMVANNAGFISRDGKQPTELEKYKTGAADWRLLAQIGEQSRLSPFIIWGEEDGKLYLWMRETDMAQGRFDKAIAIWQVD